MRRHSARLAGAARWAAITGLLAATVAGCSAGTDSGGAISAGTSEPPGAGLTDEALLVAEEMPAWNGAMGWVAASMPAGAQTLGECVLPTPESLGAEESMVRTFEAAGVPDPEVTPDPTWPNPTGVNQVALFPTEEAAAAALASWESAIKDCAAASAGAGSTAPFQIGTLPSGSTWTASMAEPSEACPECGRFDFVGVAGKGAAVTLVGFGLLGQDANYEEDPLAESLTTSLARLP